MILCCITPDLLVQDAIGMIADTRQCRMVLDRSKPSENKPMTLSRHGDITNVSGSRNMNVEHGLLSPSAGWLL